MYLLFLGPITQQQPHGRMVRGRSIERLSPAQDVDYLHTPQRGGSLKRNHRSLPQNMDMQQMVQAWQSNPSSTTSSQASSRTNIHVPPLHRMNSNVSDEELEFHETTPTSSKGISFFTGSPPELSSPLKESMNSPFTSPHKDNTHLPPIKNSGPIKRKNSYSISIPPNGDYTIRTELQVSEIVGELLRAAQTMHMKHIEPITSNKLHCQHKTVDFEVGVRKHSLASCILHFEWMHGGSTKMFNDACQELLQRVVL